jgi:hypothetical protein
MNLTPFERYLGTKPQEQVTKNMPPWVGGDNKNVTFQTPDGITLMTCLAPTSTKHASSRR